jgi:hypothetical protein
MQAFWTEMIAIGAALNGIDPNFQARGLTKITAKVIKASLLQQGTCVIESKMRNLADTTRFVSIAVDSGTILRFSALHSVVWNPHAPLNCVHVETQENKNLDGDGYAKYFRHTVRTVRAYHLEVCGIVIDNCPAQVTGLRKFIHEDGRGIIHVPCFCHMANLVFSHTIKDQSFSEIMKQIKDVIERFRSREAYENMGCRCPGIVETRWCYIEDCLYWLFKRKRLVNAALVAWHKSLVGVGIEIVYRVFLPLRLFCLAMERVATSLADVVPFVQEAMREWHMVLDWIQTLACVWNRDFGELFMNFVTSQFCLRLKRNAWNAVITAFCLSPLGRYNIRLRNRGWNVLGGVGAHPAVTENPSVEETARTFADLIASIEHDGDAPPGEEALGILTDVSEGEDEMGEVEEEMGEVEGEMGEVVDAVETPGEGPKPKPTFRELLEKEMKKSLRRRILDFEDLVNSGAISIPIAERQVRAMQEGLGLMGRDGEETDFRKILGIWLLEEPGKDGNFFSDSVELWNPSNYWRRVFRDGKKPWTDFCQMAMHFVSLGTSEAEVERTLRRQKDIQGRYGTNFGTDTLDARLALRDRDCLDGG